MENVDNLGKAGRIRVFRLSSLCVITGKGGRNAGDKSSSVHRGLRTPAFSFFIHSGRNSYVDKTVDRASDKEKRAEISEKRDLFRRKRQR